MTANGKKASHCDLPLMLSRLWDFRCYIWALNKLHKISIGVIFTANCPLQRNMRLMSSGPDVT